ncbi:branched-chain amino acid ABC transporter permease [Pusillimonas sp. SM2304]|uniref:branched-chain amino acid ABC transporter permease n=1 Tax=Pusillimonas sp. SM2304 TaxID=3073241 RepID=UPI002873F5C8|nr:branched-chain amino acid ABC transporter permease [Pusillimonas sp. SM2304]MDS1139582.1 branched-chain amino acid ABC transporter permease [Pusillimonas sp. SM2304]
MKTSNDGLMSKALGLPGTLVFLALVALFPIFVSDSYALHFVWKILFWTVAACAWNIAGGYAGQFSLGHAAFFGIGAYTSTILFISFGVSPWLGMFVGAVLAALVSVVLAKLTLRLKGPFFALATIAFAEVLRIVVVNMRDITGGSQGLSVPFQPGIGNMMFGGREAYLYVMLALLVIVVLITHALERSWLGYSLAAIRNDEEAAETLGVDTEAMKILATGISAFLIAIVGTLYAQYILLIEPSTVMGLDFSIQVAVIAIIGGMATPAGPILGALLIVPLSEYLRAEFGGTFQGLYLLVYGALLMIMVIFMPTGMASVFRDPKAAWHRIRAIFLGQRRRGGGKRHA